MRTLARLAVLVVVAALCLPAHGEILIYTSSGSGTWYHLAGDGTGEVDKETDKGYVVLDVTYNEDGTITVNEAHSIRYWKDNDGKWYEQDELEELEIVRVPDGTKVQWVIVEKGAEDGSAWIVLLAGKASEQDIGAAENQEVAKSLKGYILRDETYDGERELSMRKMSLKYSGWTKWANDPDGGDGDILAAKGYIEDYLEGKGYEEALDEDR